MNETVFHIRKFLRHWIGVLNQLVDSLLPAGRRTPQPIYVFVERKPRRVYRDYRR